MFKRLILIGLLAISAVATSGTGANAQFFDGWGWFGFSEVTGVIDLSKVPNPDSKPSIVTVTGTLDFIEVICINPANQNVAPGEAGSVDVAATTAIGSGDITNRKQAKATVEITFGSAELAAAEATAICVNPLWDVVPDSAAPKQLSLTLNSFRCVPESKTDPDPCFCDNPDGCEGGIPFDGLTVGANPDTVQLLCTVDPVLRDSNGVPVHDQVITCVEVV
jgi:hypothetical protein